MSSRILVSPTANSGLGRNFSLAFSLFLFLVWLLTGASAEAQTAWDGGLSLGFVHNLQNPALKGIEILDVTSEVSGVDDQEVLPTRFALVGAYPNPFNPTTTIAFEMPIAARVSLGIYDVKGRLIRRLVDANLPAGRHDLVWDGRDRGGRASGSGVYLYRLEAGDLREIRKITLVK